jgi:ureidoglycolate dehydrogenase (NAD+)
MQLIGHERVGAWARQCLQALGVPEDDAAIVADGLVQTSLWGIDSHGVLRLTHYLDRLQRGSTRAVAPGRFESTGPCTASMDGDNGLGILHCVRAMERAIELARASGLGAVGVRRSSHSGAVGLYARQAAAAGLIGIAFTQANAIVVPYGGRRAFLGTNPIAIAFPRAGDVPLCLDMATSQVAFNRVINARVENRPVPPGLVVDADGEPTTDPHAAVAITPLGGADYGYKGYGLALMVDLLCGALNGMAFGPHITPMYEALDTPQDLGHLVIAIDPRRFAGGETLAASVRSMSDELPREPGHVQRPGDPELRSEQARRVNGIPFEPGALADMRAWSERLGVAPLAA